MIPSLCLFLPPEEDLFLFLISFDRLESYSLFLFSKSRTCCHLLFSYTLSLVDYSAFHQATQRRSRPLLPHVGSFLVHLRQNGKGKEKEVGDMMDRGSAVEEAPVGYIMQCGESIEEVRCLLHATSSFYIFRTFL